MSDIEGVGCDRDQWSNTPPTSSSGVTDGKAESGDEIDYDGPCRYCGASEDKSCRRDCSGPCCSEASGSPEEMLREIFTAQPPAPAAEQKAKVLRDLVAWRAGFHAIDTARGSGRFTAVREALTELELIVDRADAALVTPATEGKAESGSVSAHVSKLLDVWRRQRSIVRPDEKIPTPLAVALDCLMNAVWLEKRTAQSHAPADEGNRHD